MATINNSAIQKRIISEAKIQTSIDRVPTQLAEKIVPVLIANPLYDIKIKEVSRNTTGSATIITTSTNKRTFIVGACLSGMSNSSADTANYKIQATSKGKVKQSLLLISKLTLVDFHESIYANFNHPIELEKGTDVIITHGFSVGLSIVSGTITYFEIDE